MRKSLPCPGPISRRGLMKHSLAASLAYMLGRNFIPAAWAADDKKPVSSNGPKVSPAWVPAKGKAKNVILMWMGGGPSHLDTFDPKPSHKNSGGFEKGVEAADGVQISQNFQQLAKQGRHLCVVRGVTSREGDHGQASHLMMTGYREQSGVDFPALGSIVCAEAKDGPRSELPSYVALNGAGGGAGFLGSNYAPFSTGAGAAIPDLTPPSAKAIDDRRVLLDQLDKYYAGLNGSSLAIEHRSVYERAIKLARSPLAKLFEIKGDDNRHVERYGNSGFARACFVARRLVKDGGVRFIQIDQGGWDMHQMVEENAKNLVSTIDNPMARLIEDLHTDGLLESTLVLWMGEFGRTPGINADGGRDHYPRCYSMLMAGGGTKGAQAVGKSTAGGEEPDGQGITVANLYYTIAEACGIDPTKIRDSADGRPIQVVDRGAKTVPGIFG